MRTNTDYKNAHWCKASFWVPQCHYCLLKERCHFLRDIIRFLKPQQAISCSIFFTSKCKELIYIFHSYLKTGSYERKEKIQTTAQQLKGLLDAIPKTWFTKYLAHWSGKWEVCAVPDLLFWAAKFFFLLFHPWCILASTSSVIKKMF